jgi:hypothetical protein
LVSQFQADTRGAPQLPQFGFISRDEQMHAKPEVCARGDEDFPLIAAWGLEGQIAFLLSLDEEGFP